MKKLIIHLGVHKTATTSLQEFLRSNRPVLLRHDVRYFPLDQMRREITPLIGSAGLHDQQDLRNLISQQPQAATLLSDENILGSANEILHNSLYIHGEQRLSRIARLFGDYEVEAFICVRNPADFISSMYCEFLRHNGFRTFAQYTENFAVADFSYAKLFEWTRRPEHHIKFHIVPFEKEFGGGVAELVRRILVSACGSADDFPMQQLAQIQSRPSFTADEVALLETVAERTSGVIAMELGRILDRHGADRKGKKFLGVPADLSARLHERYKAELKTLAPATAS